MNRIAVIGCGGSGKSTLSRQLGERLGIEVVHLDQLYWRPNWTPSPQELFAAKVRRAVAAERWILDGNFGSTQHLVLSAADTVVWLDIPRAICAYRVIKRLIAYHGKTRPDLPAGCPEKLDFEFLEWVLTFPEQGRPRIIAKLAQRPPDQRLIVLRNPADVAQFKRDLGLPE
jgi:adenylate kinase family enzyme